MISASGAIGASGRQSPAPPMPSGIAEEVA